MEHPFRHYENEEEDIVKELANRFHFSREERDRYIDLLRIPFCQRTHEENESIERLIYLGCGISTNDVDEFFAIKCIPVAERSPAQQEHIVRIIQASTDYQYPDQSPYPNTPVVRQRVRNLLNHLCIFPQPRHDSTYDRSIGNLRAALQEVLEGDA